MKHLAQAFVIGSLIASPLLIGCGETTRNDVTAARNRANQEERRLEEMKHERNADTDRHVTNKPVVPDESNRADRTPPTSQEIERQRERTENAKQNAADKEARLKKEQDRDTFLVDCKSAIDQANRAVEKLETKKNAADEDGKKSIDQQVNDIKSKRDAVQGKINDIRAANVMDWSKHKDDAQKAMDELKSVTDKVS